MITLPFKIACFKVANGEKIQSYDIAFGSFETNQI